MRLFEITENYLKVLEDISQKDELNQSDLEILNNIEGSIQEKSIAIASYAKNLDAEYLAIKDAADSMLARANKIKKDNDFLKLYLKNNLERSKITEINDSPYFKIKICKCPPSTNIYDADILPTKFISTKIVSSIDKGAILDLLKNGINVPGAELTQNTRLQIK